jgi:hypothetical protein
MHAISVRADDGVHVVESDPVHVVVVASFAELPSGCDGDCDGDGATSVAELIRGVRIALGLAPLGECAAFDGDGDDQVTIAELVRAVAVALDGCEG